MLPPMMDPVLTEYGELTRRGELGEEGKAGFARSLEAHAPMLTGLAEAQHFRPDAPRRITTPSAQLSIYISPEQAATPAAVKALQEKHGAVAVISCIGDLPQLAHLPY